MNEYLMVVAANGAGDHIFDNRDRATSRPSTARWAHSLPTRRCSWQGLNIPTPSDRSRADAKALPAQPLGRLEGVRQQLLGYEQIGEPFSELRLTHGLSAGLRAE